MFIGQDKIIEELDKLNLDSFPHSLMIIGEKGCGKHTLCNTIATHLGINSILVDNKLNTNDIEDIFNRPYPTLYIIDTNGLSIKAQNSLLKIIEEPPAGSYFIVLCENTKNVIPTIVNRCQQWKFQKYSVDTLSTFIKDESTDKDLILSIANTPGQVIEYQEQPLQKMVELAVNVVERLNTTSPANALTIADKMAFKDEKDKFNLPVFLRVFRVVLTSKIREDSSIRYTNMYRELMGLDNKLNSTISQQKTFENFLIKLWEASRI